MSTSAAGAGAPTGPSRPRGVRISKWVHLFAVPAVLLYGVLVLYPIAVTLYNSFFEFRGVKRKGFIGLGNFVELFTTEPLSTRVLNAIGNNLAMFLGAMVAMFLAFVIAALLHQLSVLREFFKAAFFLPRLLSLIVVGFLWQLILSPRSGALNALLDSVGLHSLARAWLATPTSALVSVIAVSAWHSIGFSILVFLAAIQAIPSNLYEAARLDGASAVRILFSITLPLTKSAWMILTVLTFIGAFETFDLVYAMQGATGAPYYGTDTLGLLFYRLAFGDTGGASAVGLGSALALTMLIIMAAASALTLGVFRPRKD